MSVLHAFIFTDSCGKYLFRPYQPPRLVTKQPRKSTGSARTVALRQYTLETQW